MNDDIRISKKHFNRLCQLAAKHKYGRCDCFDEDAHDRTDLGHVYAIDENDAPIDAVTDKRTRIDTETDIRSHSFTIRGGPMDNRERALVTKWRERAAGYTDMASSASSEWDDHRYRGRADASRDCADDLERVLGEARAAIEGEPQRETGWLIEREDDHRWAIVLPDKLISWTSDSLKALRFSRKEEAELFAELAQFSGPIKVTEHIWMEPMRTFTDFHSVNLSTGEKTRSIVGDGQRVDEVVGPRAERVLEAPPRDPADCWCINLKKQVGALDDGPAKSTRYRCTDCGKFHVVAPYEVKVTRGDLQRLMREER